MTASSERSPGYRRRIRIEPRIDGPGGAVLAMLEDDLHCMAVTLRHADGVVIAVEPVMDRAPWTTCSGARDRLVETFVGRPLADVNARRDKRENCTHLHDLATFAAAHAADPRGLVYDVAVSDPLDGARLLDLDRDGAPLLRWREQDGVIVEAGLALMALRDWIADLPADLQEPARVLQWAGLVAHGRTIPLADQSRAEAMPPACYTFQPERAAVARRVGVIRDFSTAADAPLDGIAGREMARALGT